jgi:D-methionine transport system substrate-binding protein
MGEMTMKNQTRKIITLLLLTALSACTSKQPQQSSGNPDDKKVITVIVTKKPTYPDMIRYAVKPAMEKKGYTIKTVEMDESQLAIQSLTDGEVDMFIAGHRAAYDFVEKRTGWKVATLVTVPSAHVGLFSETLPVSTVDELKANLKKDDVILVPDDPTNLSRSLIFLRNMGFLKIKDGIDEIEATEKDIVENPFGLKFKVLPAVQIPRNLNAVAAGVVFGDDADLLGILDSAIERELDTDERFLILFAVKPGNEEQPWAKDFKQAVESEAFRDVIEDPQYRFHRYYRPQWYREKWNIENEKWKKTK